MDEDECQCHDARRWRAYWSDAEVGRRLAEELRPYQDAYRRAMAQAIRDVRGWRRIYDSPEWTVKDRAESHAASVAPWSARL